MGRNGEGGGFPWSYVDINMEASAGVASSIACRSCCYCGTARHVGEGGGHAGWYVGTKDVHTDPDSGAHAAGKGGEGGALP